VHPVIVSDDQVPARRGTVSFLSSVTRNGDWTLPRHFRAVSVLGNLELDLTRARIGAGTSEIELKSVLGNITIVVPNDLRVECEGEALAGSFDIAREASSSMSPDAPLVRITGTALLGAVSVVVVDPNAPGWFERVRARLFSAAR
jgi:hypothetical protein